MKKPPRAVLSSRPPRRRSRSTPTSWPAAQVIAVGPGGVVDGKEVAMQVKEGQKVVYSKYAGTEIKIDGEEYKIVRQNDILAIVEG